MGSVIYMYWSSCVWNLKSNRDKVRWTVKMVGCVMVLTKQRDFEADLSVLTTLSLIAAHGYSNPHLIPYEQLKP